MTLPPQPSAVLISAALIDGAARLQAKLTKENNAPALKVLSRLVSDRRMRSVWQEIYKKKRRNYKPTEEFLHPACLTFRSAAAEHRRLACEFREKGLEAEAKLSEALAAAEEKLSNFATEGKLENVPSDPQWCEQDLAAQAFLQQACLSATDVIPIRTVEIAAEQAKLSNISASLRQLAVELDDIGRELDAVDMIRIADDCDEELRAYEEAPFNPNLIIERKRSDPKIRTYAVNLSLFAYSIFKTPLSGTIATTVNVVFERADLTDDKVREWFSTTGVSPLDP
jgi:hypothetical protein